MDPLLEALQCGWLDGGCHTCAKGLYSYIITSGTVDPTLLAYNIVADQRCWADHIVLSVAHAGKCWFLDANGVSSRQRLLRYWQQEEHLLCPWISDYGDSAKIEEMIPSFEQVSRSLADQLFAFFGPFSPTWLEAGGPAAVQSPCKKSSLRPPHSL